MSFQHDENGARLTAQREVLNIMEWLRSKENRLELSERINALYLAMETTLYHLGNDLPLQQLREFEWTFVNEAQRWAFPYKIRQYLEGANRFCFVDEKGKEACPENKMFHVFTYLERSLFTILLFWFVLLCAIIVRMSLPKIQSHTLPQRGYVRSLAVCVFALFLDFACLASISLIPVVSHLVDFFWAPFCGMFAYCLFGRKLAIFFFVKELIPFPLLDVIPFATIFWIFQQNSIRRICSGILAFFLCVVLLLYALMYVMDAESALTLPKKLVYGVDGK